MLLSTFAELSYLNKCGTVLLYFTIALFAIIVLIGILTKKFNKDKLPEFSKYVSGIIVGYVLCACAIMVTLKFDDMVTNGEFIPVLFYPILACICVSVALVIAGIIVTLLKPEKFKKFLLIGMGIFTLAIIACIVVISVYYSKEISGGDYYTDVSNAGLIISVVALAAVIVVLAVIFGKKHEKTTTKSIVYAAVCVALSFALSYIRLFKLPQGGSVTLVSALPIMLYSYMFGIKKGVLAGFIYGLLQAIQDPWIIHPAQFLLDYPIAFSALGLAGIMKEIKLFESKPVLNFIIGGLLGGFIRYLSHALSGIFAFSVYANMAGYSAVAWGFLYNSFALVDLALALIAGGIMLASKSFSNFISKTSELN